MKCHKSMMTIRNRVHQMSFSPDKYPLVELKIYTLKQLTQQIQNLYQVR